MADRYERYTALKVSVADHVLTIVMDNPPLNAMTAACHVELTTIFEVASADQDIWVIVFTGAGERAFCAGGDLQAMANNFGDTGRWMTGMAEARAIILGMLGCQKPVVVRINGHAMGLGASLALCGDITLMADSGRIGDPHVNVGLAAGDGGALLWPRLAGLVTARKPLLTGDPMSAVEAAAAGLVTAAMPLAELDAAVSDWVSRLKAKSPTAVQTTKRALNLDIVADAGRLMGDMLRLETESWRSPNHQEAVSAILAKRAPAFSDT